MEEKPRRHPFVILLPIITTLGAAWVWLETYQLQPASGREVAWMILLALLAGAAGTGLVYSIRRVAVSGVAHGLLLALLAGWLFWLSFVLLGGSPRLDDGAHHRHERGLWALATGVAAGLGAIGIITGLPLCPHSGRKV